MTAELAVWVMLLANAGIAGCFAYGVNRAADPWSWPPTWLRSVELWLGTKAVFLLFNGCLWLTGVISFGDGATWRGHAIYLAPLAGYTVAHVIVFAYWSLGKAVKTDTNATARPYQGPNRRIRPYGRRKEDAPS